MDQQSYNGLGFGLKGKWGWLGHREYKNRSSRLQLKYQGKKRSVLETSVETEREKEYVTQVRWLFWISDI